MNRMLRLMTFIAAFLGCMFVVPSGASAADLQLEPSKIELLDGTTIQGHLAVQFDSPEHLIVYSSPRYLTVNKDINMSVEFAGTVTTSDDFQLLSGTANVAEGGQLGPGTRSVQHIRRGTTLRPPGAAKDR